MGAMNDLDLQSLLSTPGEHHGFLPGVLGPMEAVLTVPDTVNTDYFAILGHPHSLKGGSMQNKVVTTLARTFRTLGIPSLRFNFRGVGASSGTYDAGIGESEDMLKIARCVAAAHPQASLIFAGFSFGSFVAYRTAAQMAHQALITVAPPVSHFDFEGFSDDPSPWICLQGDKDEVIPPEKVFEFTDARDIKVIKFPDTGHFFHGKLTDLKTHLLDVLDELLS